MPRRHMRLTDGYKGATNCQSGRGTGRTNDAACQFVNTNCQFRRSEPSAWRGTRFAIGMESVPIREFLQAMTNNPINPVVSTVRSRGWILACLAAAFLAAGCGGGGGD